MIPTRLAASRARPGVSSDRSTPSPELSPGRIAEVCAGRVLRQGQPAARVVIDSRELQAGDCFVALPGDRFDGHEFVREALLAGAAGAVVSRSVPRTGLPRQPFLVRVPDTHEALGFTR